MRWCWRAAVMSPVRAKKRDVFVLETPAGKLYIVCDSGYGDGTHFRRVAEAHGPLRLAILPIGLTRLPAPPTRLVQRGQAGMLQ